MKKFFALPLSLATALVLAACGGSPATTAPTTGTGAGTTTEATTAATSGATTAATTEATTEATMAATSATTDATTEATTEATTGTTSAATSAATTEATTGATTGATTEATTGATSAATTGATTEATTGATSEATTAATSATTAATSAAGTPAANSGDLLAEIQANPQLKTLATAIQAAGLEQTLQNAGPYTIFAPSDQAFASLPPATLQALLANPATLGKILSYHVAEGSLTATNLSSATSIPTLEGQPITVSTNGGAVSLDKKARVLTSDLETSNGVIHVIDQVLVPSDVTLP